MTDEIKVEQTQGFEELPEFDLDTPVKKSNVRPILDRSSYVGKKYQAKLLSLKNGRYGPLMHIDIAGEEFLTALNETNKDFFIEVFGDKPREWLGQMFNFTCVPMVIKTKEGMKKDVFELVLSE